MRVRTARLKGVGAAGRMFALAARSASWAGRDGSFDDSDEHSDKEDDQHDPLIPRHPGPPHTPHPTCTFCSGPGGGKRSRLRCRGDFDARVLSASRDSV
jgi:hypothetical protein